MLKIFDYIFYRLTKLSNTIIDGAAVFLSAVQSLNVLTLLFFLYPVLFTLLSGIIFGILWGSIWIILFILNMNCVFLLTLKSASIKKSN